MVPISIRLRGFKGLAAGVGLPEIFLDLSVLPEGIIAIAGTNGMGKTTLLDNLHPYRLMPFKLRKSKDWSPNAFSFYDQVQGPDALKELVFDMGGMRYKSVVMIDAERRKQEAYIYRLDGEAWTSLNDGKVGTYDLAIETVVGSPTLYFSSVFRAQGAKSLSDYTRGDIMGILAELLNVDHIREQGDKARAVVADLRNRVDLVRASVKPAQDDVDAAALVEVDLLAAEGRLPDLQAGVAAAQKVHEDAQAVVTKHNLEQASRESELARGVLLRSHLADEQLRHNGEVLRLAGERREALQRQASETASRDSDVAALEGRISSAKSSSAMSLSGQVQVLQSRISEAKSISDRSLAEQVSVVQARLDRATKITSGAAQIRAAAAKEPDAEALASRLSLEHVSAESALSNLRLEQSAASEKLTAAQGVLHVAEVVFQAKNGAVQSAQVNADRLLTSNCPIDKPTCNFMGSAVADRDALPALLVAVEEASTACEAARQGVVSLSAMADAARSSVAAAQEALRLLRADLDKANADLAELRHFTKLVPELDQAEEVIKVAEAEIVSARAKAANDLSVIVVQLEADVIACQEKHASDLAALVLQLEADLDARKRRFASVCEEVAERLRCLSDAEKSEDSQHLQTVDRLDMELLTVPIYDDLSGVLARLQGDVLVSLSDLNRNVDLVRGLEGEVAGHRAVLASVAGKRKMILEADAQVADYGRLIADFSLLAKACSNDGVVALELDDAAPSIAVIVNDLLLACYGSRFSVRFDTQAEKADGTKREAFDILVYDSEIDSERSITELSGGQNCWIENAITRGIALFNIHRCDRQYGTLFSDETDGPLDAGRKEAFFAVKRAALVSGTHSREFFISQTAELVDMADARIEMLPGRVSIR